ncbi:MAG TPA: DNA-binding protein, partial [Alphaproteobacteria bacterium]|nr:DNA-binding protein [Alphaproteobacteria bacterium]
MAHRPIAEGLFEVGADGPRLIGGRRKADGVITFPMPGGSDAALYDPVRLSPNGQLWAFTVQRFPPKTPP